MQPRTLFWLHTLFRTIPQAFYYSAITFLTIGLGDFTVNWTGDSAWPAVLLFILLTSFGLVLFAVLVHIAAAAILLGAREINKLKARPNALIATDHALK